MTECALISLSTSYCETEHLLQFNSFPFILSLFELTTNHTHFSPSLSDSLGIVAHLTHHHFFHEIGSSVSHTIFSPPFLLPLIIYAFSFFSFPIILIVIFNSLLFSPNYPLLILPLTFSLLLPCFVPCPKCV